MTTRRRSKFPLGLLALRTALAWAVALLLVFPLAWLFLTAFKTELQAIAVPPQILFTPTLENFHEVQERSDYLLYAKNSVITSVLSTLLGLLLAAPAAYAMAFFKGKYTKDILMWMLSTKMMPAVGALVPIYVLAQKSHLLDTQLALIIVFALSNLPIMVWMLYSHFKDIPREILEAARMDGATLAPAPTRLATSRAIRQYVCRLALVSGVFHNSQIAVAIPLPVAASVLALC